MGAKQSFILKKLYGSIDNRATVKKHMDAMGDGMWLIEYSPLDKRSNPQNAYLHAVLFPEYMKGWMNIGYDEINTPEKAKLLAKRRHLVRQFVNHDGGEVQEYVIDTSALSKQECSVFIEAVIKDAAENLQWIIPYPGEALQMDFE